MKLRGCLPEDLFFSVRAQEEDVEEGPAPALAVGNGVAGVTLEELERPTVVQVRRMTTLQLILLHLLFNSGLKSCLIVLNGAGCMLGQRMANHFRGKFYL